MAEIFFNIHGIRVCLACDDRRLLNYAGLFLRRFIRNDEADMQASPWKLNVCIDVTGQNDVSTTGLSKIGSDVWCDFKLCGVYHDTSTGVRCRIRHNDNDGLDVLASYQPSLSKRLYRRVIRWRDCQDAMYMMMVRFGLLIPALSMLCRRCGYIITHASTVAYENKGLALIGLNGCGKSGLAWCMAVDRGYRLLSDNFAVINPAEGLLLEMSEALRLEPSRMVPSDFEAIGQAYGKMQYAVSDRYLCDRAPLALMLLVSIGKDFSIRQIEPDRFSREVLAVHQFLAETPAFSFLNLFWSLTDGTSLIEREITGLKDLTLRVPCYGLTLPFAQSEEMRYEQALEFLTRMIR